MKIPRVVLGGYVLGATLFGLSALLAGAGAACSSPEKLGGDGAQCTVFTDCAGGLFCVSSGSGMVCSADAAGLVMIEEAGAATPVEAAATPQDDGSDMAAPDSPTGTGTPPGGDAASVVVDAGGSPDEASATPGDDATPADDDGSTPADDAATADEP